MRTVALGDFMPSRIPSVDPAKYPDEIFELWSIPAFDVGTPEIVPGSEIGSAKKCVEPGDVLLSRIVPHIRRSWVVRPTTDNRQIASGEWIVFRSDEFDPNYLRHILTSDPFHADFMKTVAGVGGSLLRARPEGVKSIEIPLPPLAEQERIAAILDQAARLTRLRAEALARLDTLGQAIFHEMFGDRRNFPMRTIKEFAGVKGGKRLPKGADYSDAPTSHPYIRVSDLAQHRVSTENIKFISGEIQNGIRRYIVNEGDVIISIAGSIGITAAVPYTLNGANLTENAAKITPRAGQVFDPIYLDWALSDASAQSQISAKTGQVTIGKLALFRIEQIEVPFPPIEVQRDFAGRIRRLDQYQERIHAAQQTTDTLFASLQHRAFRGEL